MNAYWANFVYFWENIIYWGDIVLFVGGLVFCLAGSCLLRKSTALVTNWVLAHIYLQSKSALTFLHRQGNDSRRDRKLLVPFAELLKMQGRCIFPKRKCNITTEAVSITTW